MSHDPPRDDRTSYDVVIVGGAFAGGSTALLLLRARPDLRVLVVEKRQAFDAKVGEATTEMSAMFLTRRLALWQHLEAEHLPKEGLRYWGMNDRVTSHANASESGGFYRSLVPSFQLRRDVLDEHVLSLAVTSGAQLRRPARARSIEIRPFDSTLEVSHTVEGRETVEKVRCRWLIDASGRACVLGKHLKLIQWNEEHPIASIWARWNNVRHLDDLAALSRPGLAAGNIGSRRLATNHYIGHGYWVWVIPLGNGQTSIGIVFDKRIHALHEQPDRLSTYTTFLRQHAALAELLDGASPDVHDLRALSRVAYRAERYADQGWALVGDAAAFIDPYYSPGLDHAAFSVEATTQLLLKDFEHPVAAAGEDAVPSADTHARELDRRIRNHNLSFERSYRWFFASVYRNKYDLLGEHDLTTASFLIDTAMYYIFSVMPAYRSGRPFVPVPIMGRLGAYPVAMAMQFVKWRMRKISDLRRRAGVAGVRNDGRRIKAFFSLGFAPFRMALRGGRIWVRGELDAVRLRLKLAFSLPNPAHPPTPARVETA